MNGLIKLVSVVVFFGLCLVGFRYTEAHESTLRKETIGKLEAKVEELRSEVRDLSNKLAAYPEATYCEKDDECGENEACDKDFGICLECVSDPEIGAEEES